MTTQVSADQLKRMTPEEIVQAHRDGRLEAVLGMPNTDPELRARELARQHEMITDAAAEQIDGANEPGAR